VLAVSLSRGGSAGRETLTAGLSGPDGESGSAGLGAGTPSGRAASWPPLPPEAGLPDDGPPEAEVPDAELPDAELPDREPPAAEEAAADGELAGPGGAAGPEPAGPALSAVGPELAVDPGPVAG
jgi:hypothetical protein